MRGRGEDLKVDVGMLGAPDLGTNAGVAWL